MPISRLRFSSADSVPVLPRSGCDFGCSKLGAGAPAGSLLRFALSQCSCTLPFSSLQNLERVRVIRLRRVVWILLLGLEDQEHEVALGAGDDRGALQRRRDRILRLHADHVLEEVHERGATRRQIRVVLDVVVVLVLRRELHVAAFDYLAPPIEHELEIRLLFVVHRRARLRRGRRIDRRRHGDGRDGENAQQPRTDALRSNRSH